jgi:hypothetical protein
MIAKAEAELRKAEAEAIVAEALRDETLRHLRTVALPEVNVGAGRGGET